MKIAVIGAGKVGKALAGHWSGRGHDIRFGVRNPADPKYHGVPDEFEGDTRVGTASEAAGDAVAVVLSVPWNAVPDALHACGDLGGKILVDCTNPVKPDLTGLTIGHTTSAAEEIARWVPAAAVVKCFNTVGTPVMERPVFDGVPATMPLCGDDQAAKHAVAGLAEEVGFEPLDVGPLSQARLLEPMAMLWIYQAIHRGMGTEFAWRILKSR